MGEISLVSSGERQPDSVGSPNQFIHTIDVLNEPIYTINMGDPPIPLTLHDWLTKLFGPSGEPIESLKTCHQISQNTGH